MSSFNRVANSLETILKAFVGLGIILVTVALLLFFHGVTLHYTIELFVAVSGAVILCMAFLSFKIFRSF